MRHPVMEVRPKVFVPLPNFLTIGQAREIYENSVRFVGPTGKMLSSSGVVSGILGITLGDDLREEIAP